MTEKHDRVGELEPASPEVVAECDPEDCKAEDPEADDLPDDVLSIEDDDDRSMPESYEEPAEAEISQEFEVTSTEAIQHIQESLDEVSDSIDEIRNASLQSASSMREMHRLLHTEFAGRLRGMQVELDTYRERDRGFVYDSILSELAQIYSNHCQLLDQDYANQQQLVYLFEGLLGILERFGVTLLKSSVGDERNNRHCQVLKRIPTGDESLHDRVAQSYNTGFYIENRTLVREKVDIYIYSPDPEHL
ncbi:MAG: hypothetical protein FWE76_07435 [Symbiobacteriaceae bacterium]|nr:hypothetical protein [Symbiobacteriaceae bacterium]